MGFRIVREPTKRELWLGERRIFFTVVGDEKEWGMCSEEVAEREMMECLAEWQAQNHR